MDDTTAEDVDNPTAFSSSDSDVLSRETEASKSVATPKDDLGRVYELDRCVEWIRSSPGMQHVCLQFPDQMLADSAPVALALKEAIGRDVYILGDTSYGSCCVDEVAAEHAQADGVIHFGHSCLSPTRRLPVLYVFTRQAFDIDSITSAFKETCQDHTAHIALLCNMVYYHSLCNLHSLLKEEYPNLILGEYTDSSGGVRKFGRRFDIEEEDLTSYGIFFVGERNQVLVNFMMSLPSCQFTSYDPTDNSVRNEVIGGNRMLMKRYFMVEKARDAKRVGILVGTLHVADFLEIIDRLKSTIKAAGKRPYIIAVGKPNPAKLANFAEIDVYVLVACPENSSYLDSKEFYQPILTPYELEIAYNPIREWTGDYVTDFRQLLPGASHFVDLSLDVTEDTPDVSLITGGVRTMGVEQKPESSSELLKREDALAVSQIHVGGGGEFLAGRSWKGLEQNLSESSPVVATKGLMGVASGYQGEGTGPS